MAGVKLSKTSAEYLSKLMTELEIEERPNALKIAFAKGIASEELPIPSNEKKELSKIEFPTSVIAKGDEIPLIKHLIIEKLQKKIDDSELDKYILLFVEHGLHVINKEIEQLSSMDNYLFYLLEKHVGNN